MSDYNPFEQEGEPSPPEDGPGDTGEAIGDGQPTEQPVYEEEPPKSYLDLDDDVSNRYVRVKAGGEELEVPLAEALQGYSRTADYTRKTQELAQQRQAAEYALTVQRALQAQPAETLRLLARQYGINFDQQSPPPQPQQQQGWEQPSPYDEGYGEESYEDPVKREIAQLRQTVQAMSQQDQQRQADWHVRSAISGLQQKYGLDEATTRQVVGTALQARMGPESFEMIYKNLAFDRAHQARQAAQAQRADQDQQRRQAGQRAGQLMGSGASANGAGATMPPASDGHLSISEAYEAALREHGVG